MLAIGCTYRVNVNPNLSVTTTIGKKLPLNVGVYIPPYIKGFEDVDSASWDEKYIVNIGEAIFNIIYKAVDTAIDKVELLEIYPTEVMISERKLDGFFAIGLNESNLDLDKDRGFLTDQAIGNYTVSINFNFFNPEMILVTSFNCIGNSHGSRSYDFLSFHGKEKYKPIIEAAIRNLGDNIVQMIYGNYDVRKLAEGEKN
jgi:hypothetical protein